MDYIFVIWNGFIYDFCCCDVYFLYLSAYRYHTGDPYFTQSTPYKTQL